MLKDGNRDYAIDPTNAVELAIKKADGKFVLIPCVFIDSTVTVTLSAQALTCAGQAVGEVRILEGTKVLTSTQFEFFVRENIINNTAIESTTEYQALDALIQEAQTVTAELTEARNALGNVDAIQAELQGASEAITQLIGDLNTKQTEVQELANTLTTKADTAQGVITSLDTIQPQITELQGLITQAQTLNTALNSLTATVNSANAVDGEIKASMQVINGWIANPEQFKGDKGDVGEVGPKGDTGPKGDIGEQGPQGEQGPKGDKGDVGPKGDKGDTGPEGPMGKGLTILGEKTAQGELPGTSDVGDAWLIDGHLWVWNGSTWTDVGDIKGPQGEQGPKGDKGDVGPQGPPGPPGEKGEDGINATTTAVATTSEDGLMSSADKTKVDAIPANPQYTDTVYTHPSTHPASMITESTTKRFVTDAEKSTWNAKQNTLTAGTNVSISGNTISAVDTVYTHPSSHPASMITQTSTARFVTDVEKSTWNSKASTDVATTSANGLMSSAMVAKLNAMPADNVVRCISLTQAAYDALSTAEKNRTDTFYFIQKV